MKMLDVTAAVLLVVGGLNWGLVAWTGFDLVAFLGGLSFGETNAFTQLIYSLVGVAALYQALALRQIQSRWNVRPSLAS